MFFSRTINPHPFWYYTREFNMAASWSKKWASLIYSTSTWPWYETSSFGIDTDLATCIDSLQSICTICVHTTIGFLVTRVVYIKQWLSSSLYLRQRLFVVYYFIWFIIFYYILLYICTIYISNWLRYLG